MRRFFILLMVVFGVNNLFATAGQKTYSVVSPDNKLKIEIQIGESINWLVSYDGKMLIDKAQIAMTVTENGKMHHLGKNARVIRKKIDALSEVLEPVVANKSAKITDNCNVLSITFRGNYSLHFRAYNNGAAYAFETNFRNRIQVADELLQINFSGDYLSYFPEEENLMSHYERQYKHLKISEISNKQFCSLPVLFQSDEEMYISVSEADLYDYPCLFLKGESNGLRSMFPKVPLELEAAKQGSDRNEVIVKEADYIAETNGKRTFPWRVFTIVDAPGKLIESDLIYQLSLPLQLEDARWITPGKVAWDWWNALNIYNVDFRAGINNQTYKYYIDFASKYGLEYIILDEGWSKTTTNIMECKPEINVEELVKYGEKKDVGVILWVLWKPLDKNLEAVLQLYENWGVKGIKVDFMARADQKMVNYYQRVAQEAAKRKLLVDFHGAFKPSGLRRAFPNVITYEGVLGLEVCKWSNTVTPEHTTTLPFTRMTAGPMDFTPGAMRNAQKENFKSIFTRPMSQGTRCHQVAMYVVYESPLQMLSDNPTNYYDEAETTEFIAKIPTVWDETVALDCKVSEYVSVARKKDNVWYVGVLNNSKPKELEIDVSFLEAAKSYKAEIMQDGINADRCAEDYKKIIKTVKKGDKIKIKLAPGGGWAAILTVE